MAKRILLTAARLRECLSYNPDTGKFTWIEPRRGRPKDGIAGTRSNRYVRIIIDSRGYQASRLAWLWMTGEWPKFEMDHINRKPGDNRWRNLRDATPRENNRNKQHAHVSWNTRDRLWVVHFSFYKKSDAQRIVKLIVKQRRKVAGSSAGRRRRRRTADRC